MARCALRRVALIVSISSASPPAARHKNLVEDASMAAADKYLTNRVVRPISKRVIAPA